MSTIPLPFLCPITHSLMRDPVIITVSGHTYERDALINHINMNNAICPISRKPFTYEHLKSNIALRDAIQDFISTNVNTVQNDELIVGNSNDPMLSMKAKRAILDAHWQIVADEIRGFVTFNRSFEEFWIEHILPFVTEMLLMETIEKFSR